MLFKKDLFVVFAGECSMALIQFGSSSCVAQWGIRRPQVAVKASFYPTRLESHQDK